MAAGSLRLRVHRGPPSFLRAKENDPRGTMGRIYARSYAHRSTLRSMCRWHHLACPHEHINLPIIVDLKMVVVRWVTLDGVKEISETRISKISWNYTH